MNPSAKRKICVVTTNRASYARIKSVLREISIRNELQLQLVVGASALLQRFGNAIDFIRSDGFEPNATVYCVLEGENPTTMAKSTGLAVVELATIFENLRPECVLTVADRYETIATAIASSYMNIPLAHTQGGETTGSIDESVRHSVTKLAHIHFPATEKAARLIRRMGENPELIFKTGCPSIDLLTDTDLRLNAERLAGYKSAGAPMKWNEPYLLVLQHPVTTEYGGGMDQIDQTLNAIHELHMRTVWLWPNVDAGSDDVAKGIRLYREKYHPDFIHFFLNFSPDDYAMVLANARCIVGNSSSGLREGSYLGVPCVNIGTRQEFRERGDNVVDSDHRSENILAAIKRQLEHGPYTRTFLFGDGTAGKRIAETLATLTLPKTQKRFIH